ncbi:16S rRNA (cytosine(967)-C(5))-methyltransferase RsmB [Marinobacterium jannaschii]|uniref:16S rRNA (cytosine(967)-C(5))-methyltransferase RsmB n=1 Tax=Marinobacterium jannaschii TaxID=64970 RepID=UPI00048632D0|nr:16S rRNA (cytosine(967)-C(5))-methyltransferase RsmB [Marinobacterium jannaschii]
MNIRTLAAETLAPLLRHQGSLNAVMPAALERCPDKDRALLQKLCFGTMRDFPRLNLLATRLLKKPFKPQDYDVRVLVLVGLYQLRSMRIPAHAAINETVSATTDLNKGWAKGLLNAILRNYQREGEALELALGDNPVWQYNHPEWFISKLSNNWPDHWQQILEGNNCEQAPLTLRVNRLKLSRQQYLEQLQGEGHAAHACRHSPDGVTLEEACDVDLLPGFFFGDCSVQDEAAQLSAGLLDLQAGQRVLDACAAPGGKLCHILEAEPALASVEAVELEQRRLPRIEENLQRLSLTATLHQADAASQDWWDGQAYDRILLDAPCSATGVIRRNPDIKYLRKGEDIQQLSQIQWAILNNCWQMLKPGGRLVYATCSIFPQENERLIKRFMAATADAVHCEIDAEWGEPRPFGRQLFPQDGGHDGFFYAVLEKSADQAE